MKGKVKVAGMHIFKFYAVMFMLAFACTAAQEVQAQSLWCDNSFGSGLFSDHKAHAVGDIVTIVISENSTATRSGASSNGKSGDFSTAVNTSLLDMIGLHINNSGKGSDDFKSAGSISNTNQVSATITATVTEVKPNGDMVITGKQTIKQNGEEQQIILSGRVRPEDITTDNTISSKLMADAQINIVGKGPLASKQRQGLLTQLFNLIF